MKIWHILLPSGHFMIRDVRLSIAVRNTHRMAVMASYLRA